MPDRYLVDTGVFVRWYVAQVGHEHALRVQQDFLAGAVVLETVDHVRVELAEVLRRKALLARHMDHGSYVVAARSIDDLGVVVHLTDPDALERAAHLASRRPLRFYDALVVDRALEQDLTLLTSDAKLVRAVAGLLSTELLDGINP